MDGKTELEAELDVMKRIVALLFGLAVLAERAAGRSYPVRCFVLWLLRRAEQVAWGYVVGSEYDEEDMLLLPAAQPSTLAIRNSPAEAIHLAGIFRALAHALKGELRRARHFYRWYTRRDADCIETDPRKLDLAEPRLTRRLPHHYRNILAHSLTFAVAPYVDTS